MEEADPSASLRTPPGAPFDYDVTVEESGRRLRVAGPTTSGEQRRRDYALAGDSHGDFIDLFDSLAADFGLRRPLARRREPLPPPNPALRPVLTEPIEPSLAEGYGDPCVIRGIEEGRPVWYLAVTSNDAPNAFPILRSEDLADWRLSGFAFPEDQTPAWCLTGAGRADFWAPEIHRVADEYWLCFAARQLDGELAIGLARAAHPAGPWRPHAAPLIGGGVIDPHIILDRAGAPLLVWKRDDNDRWPGLLAQMLHDAPRRIGELFFHQKDIRTVCLVEALWPWARTLAPMQRFFLLQPLIEAVTEDFAGFRRRLARLAASAEIEAMQAALTTCILAQPLAADGSGLTGRPTVLLENDAAWEAHLIEGVWAHEYAGRYYLFYAGNDFSTPHYGIGVAVAEAPLGPYRKQPEPLLGSNSEWWGPGHPSVAPGLVGEPQMFLHAFHPGRAGYKAFRALLTTKVRFEDGRAEVG